MSSVWLCSCNDLIANVAVLGAAAATFLLASRWPDILVGGLIASLFLDSALRVLRQSLRALRTTSAPPRQAAKPVTVTLVKGSRGS
jgi:Co/Zn/Cd efflux system component